MIISSSIKTIAIVAISLFGVYHVPNTGSLIKESEINIQLSKVDTGNNDLAEFKRFSKIFFSSIKRNDTGFLKRHIIFPISYRIQEGIKKIGSKTLFEKLHKFFPNDLIKDMSEAEYSISENSGVQTAYFITLYDDTSGVEANSSWGFTKNSGQFYFVSYAAEAG